MITENVKNDATAFGYDSVKKLSLQPRAAFSKAESQALDSVKEAAESVGMTAERTPFSARGKMPTWFVGAVLAFVGSALQALDYVIIEIYGTIIGLIFACLAVGCVAAELMHLTVPTPKKRTTANVVARLSPKGEAKRRLILVSNVDSPYVERLRSASPAVASTVVVCTILGLIISIATAASSLADGEVSSWVAILNLCFLPVYFFLLFYKSPRKTTYGANDNLSGVAVTLGVAKCLSEGELLSDTELVLVFTGGKNVGNRGAKHYAEKYAPDMQTVVVAVENVREITSAGIVRSEGLKYSYGNGSAVRLLEKAYGNLGLPAIKLNSRADLSDASAFVGKVDSTTFTARDVKADYYRTMRDTADNMSKKTLTFGIELLTEAAVFYDGGDLF